MVLALGAGGMKAVLRGSPQVAKVCPNLSSAGAKRQGDGPGMDDVLPENWPINVK